MAEDDPNLAGRRNHPGYDEDFGAWLDAQATLLSEHRFAQLDIAHLVDEVEGLSKGVSGLSPAPSVSSSST